MNKPDDLSALKEKPFADAVVKFEDLLAQSGRAFLIGAGCSQCAGLPLTDELTSKILDSNDLDDTTKKVLTAIRKLFGDDANANIEDYLSELIDHLAIADRRTLLEATQRDVTFGGESYSAALLRMAADRIKKAIAGVIEKPALMIETTRTLSGLCIVRNVLAYHLTVRQWTTSY